MQASVGISDDSDLGKATEKAVGDALAECPDAHTVLLLVTHSYGREAFESAARSLQQSALGARHYAAGMVNGLAHGKSRYDAMFNKRAAAVLAFGRQNPPAVAIVADARSQPKAAGAKLVEQTRAELGKLPSSGLLFTPGLGVGAPLIDQEILDGLCEAAPDLRVAGTGLTRGMKVDGLAEPSLAFLNGRFEEHGVLLIAFDERVRARYAFATGARESGASFRLTATGGSIWKGADGRSARDVALDILSQSDPVKRAHFAANPAIAAAEHSVCLATRDEEGYFWCAPPIGFTPDGGVVAFYPLKTGTELHRVRLDSDCAIDAVKSAVGQLRRQSQQSHDLVVSFTCTMRGFTLGDRAPEETPTLLRELSPRVHLTVIANGEIGCREGTPPRATLWAYSLCSLNST
ncbi:MAG TPA: FIST C-terminal domain-containing protein [Polyangiaceae bacterium]